MSEESEVSMLYPDYAKVNKFTGNVTVPKEKWEAKHVSANSVNSALKLGETLSNIRVSNKNAFEHRMELASMEQSVLTEKIELTVMPTRFLSFMIQSKITKKC